MKSFKDLKKLLSFKHKDDISSEICSLLGVYAAAWDGSYLPTFWDSLSVTSVGWQLLTDILGQAIGNNFKGQAFQVFDCLTLRCSTDRLYRNYGTELTSYAA